MLVLCITIRCGYPKHVPEPSERQQQIISHNMYMLSGIKANWNFTDIEYMSVLTMLMEEYVDSGNATSIWALYLDQKISTLLEVSPPEYARIMLFMHHNFDFVVNWCNVSKHKELYSKEYEECNKVAGCHVVKVSIYCVLK